MGHSLSPVSVIPVGLALLISLALSYFGLHSYAYAQERIYDPDSCSVDTGGRVFVRLFSGLAFALPAGDLLMVAGIPPRRGVAPVADPVEPAGCPDHPFVEQFFSVADRPVAPRQDADDPEANHWRPRSVTIHSWPGAVTVQDMGLRRFHALCETLTAPGTAYFKLAAYDGLEECRPKEGVDGQWQYRPLYFRARPGMHPEYAGRPFSGRCQNPSGASDCEARYQVEPGLALVYEFSDRGIPHERFNEFDLQVRAFVQSIRVPEFDAPGSVE